MNNKIEISGNTCFQIAQRIFPILRSITGEGVRKTLSILQDYLPDLTINEVNSGTQVFDWTIPAEWNCEECYIEDDQGNRIVDFRENNLHVLGYSLPIDRWLKFSELENYIFTQKDQPDAIPYVTSYYKSRCGFCLSENQLKDLKNKSISPSGEERLFHAVIRSSSNENGVLNYGECFIKGESEKEVLISTYICHPSLANNECSGPALSVLLANYIKKKPRYFSYRFIFIPETIGSITYISQNLSRLKNNVIAGFVLSCVGDNNSYSMICSRYGNTLADRVLDNILKFHHSEFKKYSFLCRGSDERQFNAPGVDLPVCGFCRTKYGTYPEYHTSKDDMSYISSDGFAGALDVMTKCIDVLENNFFYKINVMCEPQLGRRGLYPTLSQKNSYGSIKSMTDFIAYADGKNDLIDISNIINVSAYHLIDIKNTLIENKLLVSV